MYNEDMDNAYLLIAGFSKMTGISPDILRDWDKNGIFPPAGLGNQVNPYRYYSMRQVTKVNMCRFYRDTGASVKTLQELAQQQRTPESSLKQLQALVEASANAVRSEHEKQNALYAIMYLIIIGLLIREDEISVAHWPVFPTILGDVNDFTGANDFCGEFTRFRNSQDELGVSRLYPVGGFFGDMNTFLATPSQPTRFFTIDPHGYEMKPAGLYLTGYTRGYYGDTNGLPEKMAAYAKENGWDCFGPVYNIYLFNEISVSDPNQYLLQVSVQVRDLRRNSRKAPLI